MVQGVQLNLEPLNPLNPLSLRAPVIFSALPGGFPMTLVADASVSRAPVRSRASHDRLFYGSMAVILALIVLAGFGPSYYFRLASGGPQATVSGGPFTGLVHFHGALFTAWV